MLGYGRQSVDRSDIEAVVGFLQSDFLTQGPAVERFESALADRFAARHAVAVSSGTAALHVACLAAGVGPGDLGITSAITFAASANCLAYAGADAAFVDIEPLTLGMSVQGLHQKLAERPDAKVVIPVHMAGLAHASAEIRAMAKGRVVIEDAAHAVGGLYACGKPIGCGAYADMTIFSFHPVKTITTGEGGAVLTNDPELAKRLRMLRSHGMERDPAAFTHNDPTEDGRPKPWLHEQQMLGFNYRLTDIQAALGLSQLARLDRFLQRRRAIVSRYDEAFSRLPGLALPQSAPDQRARSAHHLYIVEFDFDLQRTTRTAVMGRLAQEGIGSQVHYMPVYHHPFHARRHRIDRAAFPHAERYYGGCLSLPLHPGLADEDVERVVAAVTRIATAS